MKTYMLVDDYLGATQQANLLVLGLGRWEDKTLTRQPCGKRGYFNVNVDYPDIQTQLDALAAGVMLKLGIAETDYSPARHFIGVNTDGAFVAKHVDAIQFVRKDHLDISDYREIRINTYIQRPEGGGLPIVDGIEIDLPLGKALLFDAGVEHSSTPVEGPKIRVVLSIGTIIKGGSVDRLFLEVRE